MPILNTISFPSTRDRSNRENGNSGNLRIQVLRSAMDGWSERIYNALNRCRWTSRERNLIAAFFTLLALTVLSASLADDEWIYVEGGNCRLKHIGIALFYGWGTIQTRFGPLVDTVESGQTVQRQRQHIIYSVGSEHYQDCVNQRVADIFHGLMGVLFVAVATAMGSFFLDTFGVKQGFLAWLRRHSIFNIFSVIFCVIIVGLTYWISIEVEQLQINTSSTPQAVRVSFEDGFYLVIAGAAFSICAIVANLVKSSMQMKRRYDDRLTLLEHAEHSEAEAGAAASRENLLHYYHHYRRRLLGMPMMPSSAGHHTGAELAFGVDHQLVGPVATQANAMLFPERPIGSTGPPPPLQMILNVPPPPPYTP